MTLGTISICLIIYVLYWIRHQVKGDIQIQDDLINVTNIDQAGQLLEDIQIGDDQASHLLELEDIQIGDDLINVTNIDEAGHLLTG